MILNYVLVSGNHIFFMLGNCNAGRVPSTLRLFKNKIPQNIRNCPLKVYMRVSPPFVERGCKSGIEVRILEVLQQLLHFNAEVIFHFTHFL